MSSFRLYDKKIVADLVKQGVYQNKSLTLKPNFTMLQEFYIDWARGLFDGDGSIFPHQSPRAHIRYYINLIGTKEILSFFQKVVNIERKLDYNRSIPKIVVCKKTEVNRILNLLYNNATTYLDRKYILALKAIETNLQ